MRRDSSDRARTPAYVVALFKVGLFAPGVVYALGNDVDAAFTVSTYVIAVAVWLRGEK